jgi:hypothetical protein
MDSAHAAMAKMVAVQDIEYLRRQYALATDQIGEGTAASIKAGTATYHRIFTPDATLRVASETISDVSTGPDEWVKVVTDALETYTSTQHLIGTQLVDICSLDIDADGQVTGGEATMSSYLQAWHAEGDERVWLFLGTYNDKVRFTPGLGWQIYDMSLVQVSGEDRAMGRSS